MRPYLNTRLVYGERDSPYATERASMSSLIVCMEIHRPIAGNRSQWMFQRTFRGYHLRYRSRGRGLITVLLGRPAQ